MAQRVSEAIPCRVSSDDQRISDLMQVIGQISKSRYLDSLEIILLKDRGILFSGVVDQEAIRRAGSYFMDKPYSPSFELSQFVPPTHKHNYSKTFEDGIVQFAIFGEEFGFEPGNCWALYGHMNSGKE